MKPKRQWRYSGMYYRVAACWDCGQKYGEGGWVECTIPDEIWEIIRPSTEIGSGLLCIACIVRRLMFLGFENIPVQIHNSAILVDESISDRKIRDVLKENEDEKQD